MVEDIFKLGPAKLSAFLLVRSLFSWISVWTSKSPKGVVVMKQPLILLHNLPHSLQKIFDQPAKVDVCLNQIRRMFGPDRRINQNKCFQNSKFIFLIILRIIQPTFSAFIYIFFRIWIVFDFFKNICVHDSHFIQPFRGCLKTQTITLYILVTPGQTLNMKLVWLASIDMNKNFIFITSVGNLYRSIRRVTLFR